MKKLIILLLFCLPLLGQAQTLYNNGATLQVKTGGIIKVNGGFTNMATSNLNNDGQVTVTGNVTNNQTMSAANAGTLTLNGSSAQTLSGSAAYFAKNVIVNNAAGVTLNTPLKIDGECHFYNGLLNATTTANAVTFTANGSVSTTNAPSDASHINGYAVKEGTGAFVYPVGNSTKYQPIAVNASANASGLRVKYLEGDAGSGSFTTGGSEPIALASYNNLEYWTVEPISSATGTVTVYWDGYLDGYVNAANQKVVAHLSGGNWLNEGISGSGTSVGASGSVTSNSISSWSPITLGSITVPLPLTLLGFTGVHQQHENLLTWETANEINTKQFELERSREGKYWAKISTILTQGNGSHEYRFTDKNLSGSVQYYRLKMVDINGTYTYSDVVKLSSTPTSLVSVYPNPAQEALTISGLKGITQIRLTDLQGKQLQSWYSNENTLTINVANYPVAVYMLHIMSDGQTSVFKIQKQ